MTHVWTPMWLVLLELFRPILAAHVILRNHEPYHATLFYLLGKPHRLYLID